MIKIIKEEIEIDESLVFRLNIKVKPLEKKMDKQEDEIDNLKEKNSKL